MPRIVGGKKRPHAKKHLDGGATALPDKMTLREIREKVANNGAGFTIEQMAEYLGTARSTYWFWEQGKRPMPDKYRGRVEALLVRHAQHQPAVAAKHELTRPILAPVEPVTETPPQ